MMPDVQPEPANGPEGVVDHTEATGSSRWPGVIVGIATVLAIVSVFTVWTRSQMLDTDEWVDLHRPGRRTGSTGGADRLHRWAVAARRMLAPVFDLSTGAVAGGTAVMLLALWAWSPGRVFEGLGGRSDVRRSRDRRRRAASTGSTRRNDRRRSARQRDLTGRAIAEFAR